MYLEDFRNIEDVKREYEITDADLEGVEILCAFYNTGCYDGESLVLFKKDEKLYLVNAGHCSCYGLEGQWSPVEVTEGSLKMELEAKLDSCYPDYKSFIDFCTDYFKWPSK